MSLDYTPTAMITGAARRVGAEIARRLHAEGYNLVLHYRGSRGEAEALRAELESSRPHSVALLQADLNQIHQMPLLAEQALEAFERLDLLVNNASSFYPTPISSASEAQWDDLFNSNLKGPFFLTQALIPALRESGGSIVNIVDIYADRPLANHPIYCMAKAGVAMMTKSLARDLAPAIRVNGIAPGAILWSSQEPGDQEGQARYLEKIPMKRLGCPADIAEAVCFLARSHYLTGQIIAVDGGRQVSI